jgi:putative membrane protein
MRSLMLLSLLCTAGVFGAETADQVFFKQAAEAGVAEVDVGKLAQDKASAAGVKNFAMMMVSDHTQANARLKSIATKKNVMLPSMPNPEHQTMKKKLEGLSGSAFDKAYMDGQVADHTKVARLLQSEISSGTDAEATAWASETLPTVKAHLELAKKLAGSSLESKLPPTHE